MSTTIDQKVVEMRFDNKHFEAHTRETMSTLDKLKQKLNLTGASKGLENINTSANKVNMSGMSNALDTVHSKFSALEVMGVTALANITNSAVNAGKRIVSALTIDPVKTGFQEYETQLNAVQTILANVKHKGKTLEDVNGALDELNKYADQTIYNFTEMTKNIGLFTNAGVGLDESVSAIKGFSNAAAMSGADATRTAGAMYQLSQAMSAGVVKLMDWRSLTTANIAGERFQETIIETAKVHGINVDAMIKKEGNFQATLQDGWLTADLMAEALNHYTLSRETMTEAEQEAAKAQMKANGYTEEQIEKLFDLGTEATNAATKVKSFTQLFDVLKESAQSGWAKTWQIIIGDFEEAKALFTPLANFLTGVIDRMSDARNRLLEGALSHNPFTALLEKLDNAGIGKAAEKIQGITKSLEYYQDMVNKVWRGDYKNQPVRSGLLEAEGHNFKVIQSLVNKGYQYKLTVEDVAEAEKKYGITVEETTESMEKLTDAKLKDLGLTDEEIRMYRELEKQSEETGKSISEIIASMEQKDGRTLLIESFKNAGQGLIAVFNAIKNAWVEIFPPMTSIQLYNLIAALNEFSTYLTVSDRAAENLKDTFKGVFSILDIFLTIIGGPIKIGLKILGQLFKALDITGAGVLELTGGVGRAITSFHDWLDSVLDFTAVFEVLAPYIKEGAAAVRDWIKGLGNSEAVKKFTEYLRNSKEAIAEWFKGLKESDNIAKYIFEGLINGLKTGAKNVIDFVINLGKQIITSIKEVLGIHSPSTEFFEIGKNIIQGLFNGISGMVKMVYSLVTSVGTKLIDIIKGLDIGSIFTILLGTGLAVSFMNIAKALDRLTSPFDGLNDVFEEAADTLQRFQGVLKSFSFKIKAEAIKTIATSIAILAGSVALLAVLNQGKVWSAVGAIAVLVGLLAALTLVANNFGKADDLQSLSFGKIALALIGLGAAMLLMANVVKIIGNMSWESMGKAGAGLVVLTGFIVGLIAATNLVTDKDISNLGKMLMSISGAMLILTLTAKIISGMTWTDMGKAGAGLLALGGLIVGLIAITKILEKDYKSAASIAKIGPTIFKIAGAILILTLAAKMIAGMEWTDMAKAGVGLLALGGLIVGLIAATKLITDKDIAKLGSTILGIAGAMFLLTITGKMIAGMEWPDMGKAAVGLVALGGIIVGLVATTKLVSGKDLTKVGITIMSISAAIAMLGVAAAILSLMSWEGLAKGIIAVGFLSTIMMGLIAITYFARNVKGTIITITVAVGILALAVAALSLIKTDKLAGATIALGTILGMFALVVKSTGSINQGMGTLLVLTLAITLLSVALYKLAELPIEQTLGSATALTVLLLGLVGALKILTIIGPAATAAYPAMLALAVFLAGLLVVVAILGGINKIPGVKEFLNGGIDILILLAEGLGKVIGAFVGGISSQISSYLPEIGANLTNFMEEIDGFIQGAKEIGKDDSAVKGVATLAGAIIALTAANFINGITSLMSFGLSSFADLGTQLSEFMKNAEGFITKSADIKPEIMTGVKTLAEAILILTGANVIEGLSSWLTGGNSFENFGTQLVYLGEGLKNFISTVGPLTADQVAIAQNAAAIIKTLAQTASEIPNTGGLLADLVGDNDMASWAVQLPIVASGIAGFVKVISDSGIDENAVKTADTASSIIRTLAQAAREIPNTGGLLADLIGDNDMSIFANQMPNVAKGIVGFIQTLSDGEITEDKVKVANTAASIIKTLAQAANEIPNTGGLLAGLIGDNDLSTFATQLPNVGMGIAGFANELGEFSEDKLNTVDTACQAINTIIDLANIDLQDTGSGLTSFGSNMVKFAKKVKEFIEHIGEVGSDSITSAIQKTKDLIAMASEISSINIDSIKTFGESLKSVAKDGVNGFVDEFKGESPKSKAKSAVEDLVKAGIKGAEDKKDDAKDGFKKLAEKAVEGLNHKDNKDKAKEAGKDLCQGLINGLNDWGKRQEVYNAAYALGQLAVQGEKDGQQSNSPSKATEQAGNWLGEGLILGIKQMGRKVYGAGKFMGEEATNSISNALDTALNLLNSDMDAQPTIRPVLDLSDVESGVGYLSGMFNNGPSIGVMSNLRAISSGMSTQNQNGTNSDVVSAIDKLRRDLGNVKGDTYNVNGITYDDGSNITDAVKTLVRAARQERRM